ncbi:MAG: hypothetical protein ACTSU5_00675 [Promethearchaeota archaeon]
MDIVDLKAAFVGPLGRVVASEVRQVCLNLGSPVAIIHGIGYYGEPFVLKAVYNFKARTRNFKGGRLLDLAHRHLRGLLDPDAESENPFTSTFNGDAELVSIAFYFAGELLAFSILLPPGKFSGDEGARRDIYAVLGRVQEFLGNLVMSGAVEQLHKVSAPQGPQEPHYSSTNT